MSTLALAPPPPSSSSESKALASCVRGITSSNRQAPLLHRIEGARQRYFWSCSAAAIRPSLVCVQQRTTIRAIAAPLIWAHAVLTIVSPLGCKGHHALELGRISRRLLFGGLVVLHNGRRFVQRFAVSRANVDPRLLVSRFQTVLSTLSVICSTSPTRCKMVRTCISRP